MKVLRLAWVILFFVRGPATAVPAAEERGRLLVRTFNVGDHHAGPQSLGVVPTPDGEVAFISANYLIAFDGHEWRRTTSDHPNILHSVARSADGRVYAGAVDHLGYFEADPTGRWAYHALDAQLPPEYRRMGPVLVTVAAEDGIWFGNERFVLRWAAGSFRGWSFTNAPGPVELLDLGGKVVLHRAGAGGGLFRPKNDDWEPLARDPRLAGASLVALWPEPGGGILALSSDLGFMRIEGDRVEALGIGLTNELGGAHFSAALRLEADRFLGAVPGKGIWELRQDGTVLRRLTTADGLSDSGVTGLGFDAAGTLWVTSNNGITAIDLWEAASVFGPGEGLPGGLCNDLTRHDGRLYLSLLEGLHRLEPAVGTNRARFVRVGESPRYTQQIASQSEGLLVAHREGLLRYDGMKWTKVLPATNNMLAVRVSKRDPEVVYAGHREGALALRLAPGGRPAQVVREFGGLGEVRKILEDDRDLWFLTSARGAYRLTLGAAGGSGVGSAALAVYSVDDGKIPRGYVWVSCHLTPPGFMVCADDRIFLFDRSADRFVEKNPFVTGDRPLGDVPVMLETPSGVWWMNGVLQGESERSNYPLVSARPTGDGRFELNRQRPALGAALGDVGATRMLRDSAGDREVLWVPGFDGTLRVEADRLPPVVRDWRVHVRSVVANGTNQAVAPVAPPRFPYGRHPYAFRFSARRTDLGADVRYQFRLVGWDDQWSPLARLGEAVWSGLPGGSYRLEVRAVDRSGVESPTTEYRFRVLPPPYLSWWAWIGYGGLLLGALYASGRWRARRAEARALALERVVEERTRQLATARDQAEEASRSKSRFLANMSHELRTPLNGILGFTQILARDPELGGRNRDRLRVIQTSGDHLLGLINDVLDLARVEAGRVALRPAPFDLGGLLGDLEVVFGTRAAERGLRFEVARSAVPTGPVVGDAQRLRQVLENLLGNALKFTAHGTVTLAVSAEATGIRFVVADTGPGMEAADVERLFQPFSQAASGRPPEAGAGLGLAISQHLVGLMGGRIEVESRPGIGSRFWFSVVLPTADQAPVRSDPRRIVGYAGSRRRLLVVDDLEINRRLLRELLEPLGFEVEEASTGEQAWEGLDAASGSALPDLVLLDLRMPGLDGLELTRRLRGRHGRALRIVATSASVLGFNLEEALRAGADGFLPKPFKEEQLHELLREQLGLEWIEGPARSENAGGTVPIETRPSPAGVVAARASIPDALLVPLRAAAARGDIAAMRRTLTELRGAAPEHRWFWDELETLAAGYRMGVIRERLASSPPPSPPS